MISNMFSFMFTYLAKHIIKLKKNIQIFIKCTIQVQLFHLLAFIFISVLFQFIKHSILAKQLSNDSFYFLSNIISQSNFCNLFLF